MKAKLIKVLDQYHLYDGDKAIATTIVGNPMLLPNLSKQNCDEIFGVVNVDKWVKEKVDNRFNETDGYHKVVYVEGLVEGFNKAVELNKDKVFTEEDMRKAYFDGYNDKEENKFFNPSKSIQQPTEIEVVIEMRNSRTGNIVKHDSDLEWDEDGLCDRAIPKLDSEGCLILKINKPE
jgi:hypothetical protein